MQYDKVCLETFLEKQTQLFDEPVAETLEEAEYFLEDSLAVVKKDMKEEKNISRTIWILPVCLRKRSWKPVKYFHFQMADT